MEGSGYMSVAKEAIISSLAGISDDIQDEFEVLECLYKNLRLEESRKSAREEGTLSTDDVRNKIEPYFLDDRVIISEDIQKMSERELEQEIERLEKEAFACRMLRYNSDTI
jgi:biopolymer transport protein ExbB/TolQ